MNGFSKWATNERGCEVGVWSGRRPTNTHTTTAPDRPFTRHSLPQSDWIDSPLIGQGNAPANTTTKIFFSSYLDRLISVNEQEYKFSATFLLYLTWTDPDAPAAVADATADAAKPSGDCARYCDNTHVPKDGALCCDSLFMPSLV